MIKQIYFKHCCLGYINKVKWFKVLQCIINNSIKHQSFVYTQLDYQTVLFLTIQFSISHLIAHCLNVKHFYLTLSGATTPGQSGPESIGNEGVLSIPKAPVWLESHHQIALCHIKDTNWSGGCLTILQRYSLCFLQPQLTGHTLFKESRV